MRLPQDYKEYVSLYGTGRLGSVLDIWNPFASNPYSNLIIQSSLGRRLGTEHMDEFLVSGLPLNTALLFGDTRNGDLIGWLTATGDEWWPIFILEVRSTDYEVHQPTTGGVPAEIGDPPYR